MNFISNVCPFVLGILKGRYADYFSFLIYLELENKAQQDDGPKRLKKPGSPNEHIKEFH